jgi:hypothetical protein
MRRRVLLPTAIGKHIFPWQKPRSLGFDNLANDLGLHHIADFHRRYEVGPRIHPASHVRIERKINRAQKYVTLSKVGHRSFLEPKVLRARLSVRMRGENNAAIHGYGHRLYAFGNDIRFAILACE